MFGRLKRRVEMLEKHRAYTEDYQRLNERYWELRRELNMLLNHLKVYVEEVPSHHKLVQKGGPEKGSI